MSAPAAVCAALALALSPGTAFAQVDCARLFPARAPVAASAEASATLPGETGVPGALADVPAPPPGADLPQVDTIIPDAEFTAAIPAQTANDDAELDRPLEAIDAFEARLAARPGAATPPIASADTTVAGGTAPQVAATATAAPADDAALAQPLPPLASFQVEPVQIGAAPAAEARQVRYQVCVAGLESADRVTDYDLAGEFRRLSALKGGGRAENTAMISARLTADSKLMQQLLASQGWYAPTVTTRLDQAATPPDGAAPATQSSAAQPSEPGTLIAALNVTPGKRYVLSDITVQAGPTVPPGLIAGNLALRVGEPIVADRVQGAEAQVAVALPQNGYPFARVGQRDILLDPDTGGGAYTLPVEVGPRARFGDFATVPATGGDLAFDARHVQVLARYKKGELYDSRKVDDLRQALVATGLFSTVTAEPKATGEPAADDTQYVTTLVTQDAGPPRTIAATVGYGTGEGFTAQGSWTHRNLFPPEGALIASAIAGTKQQGAGLTFRRSNAGQRDRTFELAANIVRSTYDAYNANTARLAVRISRDSTPIWQKRFTWALGAQVLGTREQVYDVDLGRRDYKSYLVGGLTGQAGLDFSDSLLNPTRGFRVTTLIEPEGSLGNGFTPYLRARIDASGYYPFGETFVLAGRVRFGTIQGATLDDLAPSRRFYAGGGGSVRGYAYQKLGQLDPNRDPIGGRSLTEGSVEARYRFGNYGIVGFVDAGQSYPSTSPGFSDMRYGVGVGGRFYTNFGPLRLDVATPLGRRAGEGRLNVYVSIGQAF